MKKNKKGFTFIEILVIVGIIGILVSLVIIAWAVSVQKRSAIASYKTSMKSVRTAAEMCRIADGTIRGNVFSGSPICDYGGFLGTETYPTMPKKCGNPNVEMFRVSHGNRSDWIVTTDGDCLGCRLVCDVNGCEGAVGQNNCN